MGAQALVEPPLSADEYKIITSPRIGDAFDGPNGMTVAYVAQSRASDRGRASAGLRPTAESYINIIRRDPADTAPPRAWKYEVKKSMGTVEVEPRYDAPPARITVAAQSGAGKSTWIGKYVRRLVKPETGLEQPVWLLSKVLEDKALDDIPDLRRIDPSKLLEDTETTGPLPVSEFANSVLITDDISSLPKAERVVAEQLRSDALEISRHGDTTLLSAVHLLFDGSTASRRLLLESNAYVIFPRASGVFAGKRLLKEYMGMSPADARRLLGVKSRWLYLQRQYPSYAVWEGGVTLN